MVGDMITMPNFNSHQLTTTEGRDAFKERDSDEVYVHIMHADFSSVRRRMGRYCQRILRSV